MDLNKKTQQFRAVWSDFGKMHIKNNIILTGMIYFHHFQTVNQMILEQGLSYKYVTVIRLLLNPFFFLVIES